MERINFYDTNALLHSDIEKIEGKIYLSSITLQELEHIKTSRNKDEDLKFQARKVTRWLRSNEDKYECVIADNGIYGVVERLNLEIDNDNIICASAYSLQDRFEVEFVTNDICCYNIAKNIFKLQCSGIQDKVEENYKGYKEIIMTDKEMATFYETENKENIYGLEINEYLIIKDTLNQPLDAWKYDGLVIKQVKIKSIQSNLLGKLKAKDFYQQCAIDSFDNNQITMIKGKAGSGKSHLSMSYAINQMEKGKIDKIIMFINDVPVKGSNTHGFLPGSLQEKLTESQIGNFLGGKLGSKLEIAHLISMEKLVLLPISDIRGFDTTNQNALIYITEAQNLNISMLKLAIQRVGEDCKVIIDGDYTTQVDSYLFEGKNNGMRRLSEVFSGREMYGEVQLDTCYRSKLATIAELM